MIAHQVDCYQGAAKNTCSVQNPLSQVAAAAADGLNDRARLLHVAAADGGLKGNSGTA